MQQLINTCIATTSAYHTIAYYTHLVPLALSILMIGAALVKSNTKITRAFSWFACLFSVWLMGDLLLWVLPDYIAVYTIWSVLDFINVLFCLAAVYFFYTLVADDRRTKQVMIGLVAASVPAFLVTILGSSVTQLHYSWCEVSDSAFLTYYKLAIEIATVAWITISGLIVVLKKDARRMHIATVGLALVAFILTFSITDYISSQTGVYEIGLYGLFVLPISLTLILFVIIRGDIFKFRSYGIQVGVYSFIILVASQFLFIDDTTGHILNTVTLVIALVIAYIVAKQINQEHTHQREVENLNTQLSTLNVSLADLNQQKNEFLSLATHQLRSPLTSIKWGVEAIEDAGTENMTALQLKTLFHIETTTNDLIRVVGDLLDVSKIDQGKLALNKTDIQIDKLVQKVVDEFDIVATHKGLDLVFEKHISASPVAYSGDETKMQQVITNLIDNAIKYTEQGSITVVLDEKPDAIVIAVKDTGAGISKDEMATLFSKFVRGNAGKKASGGSGLGLYLVKQVVEMHGGKVSIASDGEGKGSTFSVTLPKNDSHV